jgi:hypothetical protein
MVIIPWCGKGKISFLKKHQKTVTDNIPENGVYTGSQCAISGKTANFHCYSYLNITMHSCAKNFNEKRSRGREIDDIPNCNDFNGLFIVGS